jgi:hypothetical protein
MKLKPLTDPLVFIQILLVIAAFLIERFEDAVSLSMIRYGYFIHPTALSAICLAILIFLQGIYFHKIQKKKMGFFFSALGAAIFIVNITHIIMT